MKNIVLDMDGVIADFPAAFKELFGYTKFGAEWAVTKEEWKKISETDGFWADMPPLDGAATLAKMSPLNRNFYLLTSRAGNTNDKIMKETRIWLEKNGIELFDWSHLIFSTRPGKVDEMRKLAPASLLDDSIVNVGMVDKADYCEGVLMLTPWNRPIVKYFPDIPHVSSVKEFLLSTVKK